MHEQLPALLANSVIHRFLTRVCSNEVLREARRLLSAFDGKVHIHDRANMHESYCTTANIITCTHLEILKEPGSNVARWERTTRSRTWRARSAVCIIGLHGIMSSFSGLGRRRMISASGEDTSIRTSRGVECVVAEIRSKPLAMVSTACACARDWHRVLTANCRRACHGRPPIVGIEHGIDQFILLGVWPSCSRLSLHVIEETSTINSTIGVRRIGAQPWSYLGIRGSGVRRCSF